MRDRDLFSSVTSVLHSLLQLGGLELLGPWDDPCAVCGERAVDEFSWCVFCLNPPGFTFSARRLFLASLAAILPPFSLPLQLLTGPLLQRRTSWGGVHSAAALSSHPRLPCSSRLLSE